MTSRVFDTLFKCMEDYSMDKRGDVGSWVRCAALVGLEATALEAVRGSRGLRTAEEELEGGEEEILPGLEERLKTFVGDDVEQKVMSCVRAGKPMREEWAEWSPPARYFDVPTAVKMLGLILKQLAEKLDNVRDLAGNILSRLLNEKVIPCVADRVILVEALRSRSDVAMNWASPGVTFGMVVKAMNIDSYHAPIVEGLVVSVGGLTESVVKSSSAALLDWMKTMKKLKGWR